VELTRARLKSLGVTVDDSSGVWEYSGETFSLIDGRAHEDNFESHREIATLIRLREVARREVNFAKSNELRNTLVERGVELYGSLKIWIDTAGRVGQIPEWVANPADGPELQVLSARHLFSLTTSFRPLMALVFSFFSYVVCIALLLPLMFPCSF
jgi:hypothetical protein